MRRFPLLVVLAALAVAAAPAPAASPVVATVGTETVTKAQFDHWLRIAAITRAGPEPAGRVRIPRRGTRAWRGLRDQVMQLLVQNLWVQGEAALRGITLTGAEVRRAFREQLRQSFPEPSEFRDFLRTSGFTRRDILFRVRLEQLSSRLREQVVGEAPPASEERLRAYYDANVERFVRPERRDLRIVRTRTRAEALAARRDLRADGSPRGRVLIGVAEGQQEPALDRAIFRATRGRVTGPVRTRFGFYVFRVIRVKPERTQPYEKARETIRAILLSEDQQAALDRFIRDFERRWRPVTTCRPRYATADCANAPIPTRPVRPEGGRRWTATIPRG